MNSRLHVVELFSSIQGEGPLVGVRQIFVRLFGCDVRCSYCDTPHDLPPAECLAETPASGPVKIKNPATAAEIADLVRAWTSRLPGLHHSVSITGGEPLLHADVLREWLPEFRSVLPIYLETSGLHVPQLQSIISLLDIISMDIKLPSVAGIAPRWDLHRQFLSIAVQKQVYVKMVVSEDTAEDEVLAGAAVVADVDRTLTVVLQPVTLSSGLPGVSGQTMLRMQEAASSLLADVRVIPQTHRFLNVS